jgi:hypothetical protein
MPRKLSISLEIQAEVQKLVDEFNREHFKKANPDIRALFSKTSAKPIALQKKNLGMVH